MIVTPAIDMNVLQFFANDIAEIESKNHNLLRNFPFKCVNEFSLDHAHYGVCVILTTAEVINEKSIVQALVRLVQLFLAEMAERTQRLLKDAAPGNTTGNIVFFKNFGNPDVEPNLYALLMNSGKEWQLSLSGYAGPVLDPIS